MIIKKTCCVSHTSSSRSRQDSNLRGNIQKDFKSIALTTRLRLRITMENRCDTFDLKKLKNIQNRS